MDDGAVQPHHLMQVEIRTVKCLVVEHGRALLPAGRHAVEHSRVEALEVDAVLGEHVPEARERLALIEKISRGGRRRRRGVHRGRAEVLRLKICARRGRSGVLSAHAAVDQTGRPQERGGDQQACDGTDAHTRHDLRRFTVLPNSPLGLPQTGGCNACATIRGRILPLHVTGGSNVPIRAKAAPGIAPMPAVEAACSFGLNLLESGSQPMNWHTGCVVVRQVFLEEMRCRPSF